MNNFVKLVFALAIVVFSPGCQQITDFFNKKTNVPKKEINIPKNTVNKSIDNSSVLLNIDGTPVITENDFNKHLTQMLQVNPYLKGASVDSLPAQLKRKFFDELIKQELIIAWANKNNIDQDPEFQKSYEEMKHLVKRSLLVQRFETKLLEDVKITDAEIKDYFNKNKDKFVKEPGGVLVEGIAFDNDTNADAFMTKLGKNFSEFKVMAKAENKNTFKSFGRVNNTQAGLGANVPKLLKDKALSLSNLPAIAKVKAEGKIWVICASDKKDTKYFDFNEIKEQLRDMIKQNKFREILDEKIKDLRSGFTVDVNEDFFKEGAPVMPQKESKKSAPVTAAV